jgi:uncharacterized protein YcfL
MTITGEASIAGLDANEEAVEYSFWRYDAKGYVLVKDWGSEATLTWKPGKAGNYNIQVRAKGEKAKSYEVAKSISVNVTGDQLAQVGGLEISFAETPQARVPVVVRAKVTGENNSPDLLYKFYVYDEFMLTRQIQNYSPSNEVLWTPRKAGQYKIMVLVKNEASYGKYDVIESQTITVN